MTETYDAPWFDALSDTDKVAYREQALELANDLYRAAEFIRRTNNMRAFPMRSYQPEVDLQYFVNNTSDEDPKGTFAALARNIVAAGGTTFDRHDVERGTVQHNAELRFGSGRVAYRALWIEPVQSDN